MDNFVFGSAASIIRAIREKKISVVEVVTQFINQIEAVNPIINAIVQFIPDQAIEAAQAADLAIARREALGPLHGVPFTVKDHLGVSGLVSTGGTLGLRENVVNDDCELVNRMRKSGAILLGKTNMPELGRAIETDNLIYGRTNNPYDLTRFAGGSSGGESAIIAAGGSALGIGTDGGGSIREPAHYCGIAGIKPTNGRLPKTGFLFPPTGLTSSLSQAGPMARYVEDLILSLPLISGPDGLDPNLLPIPVPHASKVDIGSLRVAYYTDNGIVSCTSDTVSCVQEAVLALKDIGVNKCDEVRPPGIEKTLDLYLRLHAIEGTIAAREHLRELGTESVSPFFVRAMERMEAYEEMTAQQILKLIAEWNQFKIEIFPFMQDYDLIICPTTSIPAMPHGSSLVDLEIYQSYSYCATYNLCGWPAATVRAGTSSEGLPIGIQTVAAPFREDIVLAAAQYLETTLGGYQRPIF
jgi:amidase